MAEIAPASVGPAPTRARAKKAGPHASVGASEPPPAPNGVHVAAPASEPSGRATIEDWLAISEEKRAELITGRIVYHAFPGVRHGDTQAQISAFLRPYRGRSGRGGGGGGPGGWWLSQEVDMEIGDVGCRPDVVGWRRDKHARVPEPDARGVITVVPDFLCEVISKSTARYDRGAKRDAYFKAGVPHYWLVDPSEQSLTLLEWTARGYLIVRVAGRGETVRAAPFEAVEIPIDELFMDEEGELGEGEPGAAAPPPPVESAPSAPASEPPAPRKPAAAGSKKRPSRPRAR